MTLSMYQASIPVFIRALTNLSAILVKAEKHAEAKKIDQSVLIQSRLYPDMLPLAKQIQITSDVSKGAAARLSGIEVPSFADTETTFAELQERINKTISFLKTVDAGKVDGSEKKSISLKVGGQDMTFSGQDYLLGFAIPNVFFHVSVAYSILRHNGVELGKRDFLGNN